MRNSLRRLSIGRTGGGVTLGEKLDAGRADDSGVTDPTERSLASSVCMNESRPPAAVGRPVRNKAVPCPASQSSEPLRRPENQRKEDAPRKPHSQRRRSIFGSSSSHGSADLTPDIDSENVEKPKSQRRQSMFVGSAHSSIDSSGCVTQPGRQLTQTSQTLFQPEKPECHPRRRSLVGSTSSNQETKSRKGSDLKNPPSIRSSGKGSVTTSSANQTAAMSGDSRCIADIVPPSLKPPRSPRRSILKNSSMVHQSSTSDDAVHSPKMPFLRRRFSLIVGRGSTGVEAAPPSPQTPRSRRRNSLLGNSFQEPKPTRAIAPDQKSSSRDTELDQNNDTGLIDPYDLVNKERARRSLPPFSRNMLLDSIAKDVSLQLAMSAGTKCTPTNYYGNIGKGVNLLMIHTEMMAQRGNEKKKIVSSKFSEVGIGFTKCSDGQIFLCQLFR